MNRDATEAEFHASAKRVAERHAKSLERLGQNRETCEKCGESYGVGEDYRCPHGAVGKGGVIDDTLTGGARWMHNLGDKPVWVETKTQLKHELSSRGLVQAERNTYNRSDKSPYATRTRLRIGQRDPFVSRA